MNLVVPAVLPASRKELSEKLALFLALPVERVQIDVVDGMFAAPPSWPYTAPLEFARMVKREEMLPKYGSVTYEIDLMCTDIDRAVAAWITLGARRFIFHAEAVSDLPKFLKLARVRYAGDIAYQEELISFGVALNISSDLALLEPCLPYADFVQFMGIAKIGVQGQSFDERVLPKVRVFRAKHPDISVQVDGGVSLSNAKRLLGVGVTNLVVGSALTRASDPSTVLSQFEMLKEQNP